MTMNHAARHGRLKLVALLLFLSLPVLVATVMALWRVGIPEGRTAHGELAPEIPVLAEWPLATSKDSVGVRRLGAGLRLWATLHRAERPVVAAAPCAGA